MKRMHVHVSVENIPNAIGFYSALFAAQPAVVKDDYAKWMLDDPRINFAISTRGSEPGLDHLGIQVENQDELQDVYSRLRKAAATIIEQGQTTCCYAKSEKSWINDPAGISWETFLTTGEATTTATASTVKRASLTRRRAASRSRNRSQAGFCVLRGLRPWIVLTTSLFLCTGNSARSIIAEAIMNREGRGNFRAFSAGSQPKGQVHPHTLALLQKMNFDVTAFVRSLGTSSPRLAQRRSILFSPSATTRRAKPARSGRANR